MKNKNACLITFAALLLTAPAFAAPPPAPDQSDTASSDRQDVVTGRHVEGHIAFLKAELGITPAQEALWQPVADAMRQDVHEMNDAEKQVARDVHGRETAIAYLQHRTLFANLRAQGEARFYNAMQPLYESLTPHQQKMADELLIGNDNAPR